MQFDQFFAQGWCQFKRDPQLLEWVESARDAARCTLQDPDQAQWLRYQGTWFAGVNALPNNASGAVNNSGPLRGAAVEFVQRLVGCDYITWDRAQVSICYPGYPQPMEGQSDALHRFRVDRDAAHVDGLLPEGSARRRHLREHHLFILGIPMSTFSADASPFVVWEGSHHRVRHALSERFRGIPSEAWGEEDIMDVYQAIRREVFDECRRVEIHAQPGEAFVAHRLCVHGMAPWGERATADADGRVICYFRPESTTPATWLNAP